MSIKYLTKNWILITYDLPRTKVKERLWVVRELRKLGAIRHTYSVYLLPYSQEAEETAKSLKYLGEVYIWKSEFDDKASYEATKSFFDGIIEVRDEIKERIDDLNSKLLEKKGKLSLLKQRLKTIEYLLIQLDTACQRANENREKYNYSTLQKEYDELCAVINEIKLGTREWEETS